MKKYDNIREKIKKSPYRGVLTEIAKEQGVTRQAIHDAVFVRGNLRILTILENKLRQRRNQIQKLERELLSI